MFKEHTIVEGRKPANSLYDEKLAAYTSNEKETVKNDMNNLGRPPNLLELKVNLQLVGLLVELDLGR